RGACNAARSLGRTPASGARHAGGRTSHRRRARTSAAGYTPRSGRPAAPGRSLGRLLTPPALPSPATHRAIPLHLDGGLHASDIGTGKNLLLCTETPG